MDTHQLPGQKHFHHLLLYVKVPTRRQVWTYRTLLQVTTKKSISTLNELMDGIPIICSLCQSPLIDDNLLMCNYFMVKIFPTLDTVSITATTSLPLALGWLVAYLTISRSGFSRWRYPTNDNKVIQQSFDNNNWIPTTKISIKQNLQIQIPS